jgi:hypothetical protein
LLAKRVASRDHDRWPQFAQSVTVDRREQDTQFPARFQQVGDRANDCVGSINESAQQRAPREVDGDLVGDAPELLRKTLHSFHQKGGVRQARSLRPPCAAREGVGARVDGQRERGRLGPRAVQNIATVTRSHVHENVAERGGYRGGLTDVDVDEALAEKSTHIPMVIRAGTAALPAL